MKRIVFLCSGGGGNLKFIYQCILRGIIKECVVSGVISDRECGALAFCKKRNIPADNLTYDNNDRISLGRKLQEFNPDIIIANIHKILDDDIVGAFWGKLINVHYSLLPAFAGMIGEKPVIAALNQGCKFIGTTVHFIDKKVDAGTIISQSVLAVNDRMDMKGIMEKVFRTGCLNLLNAFKIAFNVNIAIMDNSDCLLENDNEFIYNPPVRFNLQVFDDLLWNSVK